MRVSLSMIPAGPKIASYAPISVGARGNQVFGMPASTSTAPTIRCEPVITNQGHRTRAAAGRHAMAHGPAVAPPPPRRCCSSIGMHAGDKRHAGQHCSVRSGRLPPTTRTTSARMPPVYTAYAAAAFFAARAASRRPVPHVVRFFFFRSFHCLRDRVFFVPSPMRIKRYRGSNFFRSSAES